MAKAKLERNIKQAPADRRELKLLLVDEDANDLNYYSEVLRYLGYKVHSMDSYSRAADTLGSERFDLVIVDQGSSDFEGRSVLSRAVETDRHVPVLVLARTVDVDCCLEALDAGAHEYVQKPLSTSEVQELVSDYVQPSAMGFSTSRGSQLDEEMSGDRLEENVHAGWRKAS